MIRILFVSMALAASVVRAEVWTNTAGHTITAQLVGIEGEQARFQRKDGTTFSLHLKALSRREQLRARRRFPAPPKASSAEKVRQRYEARQRQHEQHRKNKTSE